MADETPVLATGPAHGTLAGLLAQRAQEIEVTFRIGWQVTPDGALLPVPVMEVQRD
ncbi:hypothetical protein [Streptomyces sp. NPDC001089]